MSSDELGDEVSDGDSEEYEPPVKRRQRPPSNRAAAQQQQARKTRRPTSYVELDDYDFESSDSEAEEETPASGADDKVQ